MKKIYSLGAAIIISMLTFGQAQRLVLFEEFTGENCPPCATDNAYVYSLAASYPAEVVLINYLIPIPSAGVLSEQVSSVCLGRTDYYGVTSAPWGQQDGAMWDSTLLADYGNNPITWCVNLNTYAPNPDYLNAEYAVPSPFSITVSDILTGTTDSFYTTVKITAAVGFNSASGLKLQLAMVENIEFAAPPGNDGETSWGNAVRAMYPTYNGTTIASNWTDGQTQSFTFSGPLPSFIRDKTKVRFVAFIQDANKHVQQTGISPYYTFNTDVAATGIVGSFANCPSAQYNPVINISNAGNTALTSCTVSEYVDNVFVDSVSWTGNIAAGNSTQYALPALTIASGAHKLTINLTSPNHTTDLDTGNDTVSINIWIPANQVSIPLIEGFENGDPTLNDGWAVESPDHDSTWRVVTPGDTSTHSYMVDFYDDFMNFFVNPVNNLYAPPVNLANTTHAMVKFSFANQWINFDGEGYGVDSLYIDVSSDCGNTWTTVYGTGAASAPAVNLETVEPFVPTGSEWITDSADISVATTHQDVLLRFRPVFDDGENFYLDNINIYTNSCTIPLSNNISGVTCPGLSNGSVTVTPTQGGGTYSYSWSNGGSGQSLTGLSAGTYYATVNNNAGCVSIDTVVIQPGVGPDTAVTASGPLTFCSGDSVILTAVQGYTYLWSNDATTQAITVTASGRYSVQVTNGNACSAASAATVVTVNPSPTATITANGPTSFCTGGSVTLSGSAGSSWLWSNNATTQAIVVTSSGNFTVRVTNAGGCSATSAATVVTVNSNPVPTITPGGPTTFCQGGSVVLTASQGTAYAWSNGATTQAITVTASGAFTVYVTVSGGCSGTSTATVVTVNDNPVSTITAGGNTTFCQGGSVTLTASAGSGWLWSNSATTQTIAVTSSGLFTVLVTNASGCSATSSGTQVTVNPIPTATITASGPTTFCTGDSVTLTASAGSSWSWSNGATAQSIDVNQAGNYLVQVTNSYSCTALSSLTSVSLEPATSITVQPFPQVTCVGGTVTFSVTADGQGLNYQWKFNGNDIQGGNNSASYVIPDAGTSDTGSYSVVINGTCGMATSSSAGLSLTDTIQISEQPQSQVVCAGQPVSFTCVANAGNVSYQWKKVVEDIPGATLSTYSIDSATLADAANYTCFITSSCGTTTSAVASLTVNSPTSYTFSESICAGSNYTFNGQFLSVSNTYTETLTNAAGCDSIVTLHLTVTPPLAGSISTAICSSESYSFGGAEINTPGIYYDTLSTLAGCDSVVTLNLTAAPPITSAVHAFICTGSTYNFNGVTENAPGIYKDTISTEAGCDSIVTLTLDSLTAPVVTLSNDTLQTESYSTYQWFLNDTIIAGATTQSIVITQNGNYSVAVTNGNNCGDTSVALDVTTLGINNIALSAGVKLFPNPNDGNFTIQLTGDLPAEIEIFDAVGKMVTSALKVESSKSFNLNNLSAGLYFLHITQNNQTQVLKFSVMR